jgi:protein-disulfide isomerase
MPRFKKELDAGTWKARVDAEAAEGDKVGAGGTPTFFVNGYKLVGAQPVDAFKKLIDEQLAKKK